MAVVDLEEAGWMEVHEEACVVEVHVGAVQVTVVSLVVAAEEGMALVGKVAEPGAAGLKAQGKDAAAKEATVEVVASAAPMAAVAAKAEVTVVLAVMEADCTEAEGFVAGRRAVAKRVVAVKEEALVAKDGTEVLRAGVRGATMAGARIEASCRSRQPQGSCGPHCCSNSQRSAPPPPTAPRMSPPAPCSSHDPSVRSARWDCPQARRIVCCRRP